MTTTPLLTRGPITDNGTDNGLQQDSGVVATTAADTFDAIWRDSGNFNSGHATIVGRAFNSLGNPTSGDVALNPLNNAFGVPFNASQPAATPLRIAGQSDGLAVAFTDNFNNGADFDVYVVRTNASLNRLENPLLIDGSTSVTNDPSITSFADGSLVVSYTIQNSATDWDILARTVSAAGVVGPVITLFNDTDRSDLSDLATLKNGNFVAVFESPFLGSATDTDVFFTIKTENGTNVVSPTTVVGAGSTATETNPHVAALAGGGFVVTWTDSAGDVNGTSQGIRASVYAANGNIVAGDILVNQFNQTGTQLSNDVTALSDGGFEVIWEDVAAAVDRVQRFDSAGNLVGVPVTVSNIATFNVNAATMADGRSIVTVNDFSSGNNNTVSTILDTSTPPDDFFGNGMSGILFQNVTIGQLAIWQMNGSNLVATRNYFGVDPNFKAIGTGDFDGDGKSDILFQYATTGQPVIWQMSGFSIMDEQGYDGVDPSFKVIGTGDFNGDGKSDILFQNTDGTPAIWEMDGTTPTSKVALDNPSSFWHLVGAADVNGDGMSDLVWQAADGTPAIWEMNGTTPTSKVALDNPSSFWHLVGTGDFNGDGMSDLLWQADDGTPAIWLMNGTTPTSQVALFNPGPSWHVIGAEDLNGDGKSDIVFQNDNGQPAVWLMNGTTPTLQTGLFDPGSAWHVIPGL